MHFPWDLDTEERDPCLWLSKVYQSNYTDMIHGQALMFLALELLQENGRPS